jgi:hypothetical protein
MQEVDFLNSLCTRLVDGDHAAAYTAAQSGFHKPKPTEVQRESLRQVSNLNWLPPAG